MKFLEIVDGREYQRGTKTLEQRSREGDGSGSNIGDDEENGEQGIGLGASLKYLAQGWEPTKSPQRGGPGDWQISIIYYCIILHRVCGEALCTRHMKVISRTNNLMLISYHYPIQDGANHSSCGHSNSKSDELKINSLQTLIARNDLPISSRH